MVGGLDWFRPKAPPLVGVDISSSSVKVVELSEAGKGQYRVERYAIEPLPREAVVDGNIANLDAAAEVLQRAWRRSGSRIKNVAMALPSALVITKKVIVPAGQREEDLELQVESEANQYIPFALDEVNLDFQVLGPAPSGPEECEVLIAASRKDKVEDRVAVSQIDPCGERLADPPERRRGGHRGRRGGERLGDEVFVTLTLPDRNIDASQPVSLEHVDVWAYTGRSAPARQRWFELGTLVERVEVPDAADAEDLPPSGTGSTSTTQRR